MAGAASLVTRSLVENSNDREQVKNAQRIERERAKDYRVALERIANTSDGEILFERIAEYAALFTSSFSVNSRQTAFNEGRRSLGLTLLADWTLARPDAMAALLAKRAKDTKAAPLKPDIPDEETE